MNWHERLRSAWAATDSQLCVGLDPDAARLPDAVHGSVVDFCTAVIDATADLVCAYKPQIAYFAAAGQERALEHICAYVRDRAPQALLILDAKRADIGSTAAQYAVEAFDRYGAHVVTVNPYLGGDSVEPFLLHPNGGAIVLCRTSNPGSGDFQGLLVDGEPLYIHVARRVADDWNNIGPCGLVVGATYPAELARVRAAVGDLPILIPGVGAQGGDVEATCAAGATANGLGMIINSSRAILYARDGEDFVDAARLAAEQTRDSIRRSTRS
jgi:orotidine-5'-phosphate decarboxylase